MFESILKFWFEELEPRQWWVKDDTLDALIIERFSNIHAQACQCELYSWRTQPQGRLSEIIVIDQFSRNMFRGNPASFAYDSLALALAQEAVSAGADKLLNQTEKNFLYMPYMHSESLAIHDIALELFQKNGAEASIEYEIKHRDIIARFGRYPHRNAILGRESTAEEVDFLSQPGSSF